MLVDETIIRYDDDFYLVKDKKLVMFISDKAMLSWNREPKLISNDYIEDECDLSEARIGFRQGTPVHFRGTNYVVDRNRLRKVTDSAFDFLGFDNSELIELSNEEFRFYKEGELIG